MLVISSALPSRQIPSPGNLEVVSVITSLSDIDVIFSTWCVHHLMLLPPITPIFSTT